MPTKRNAPGRKAEGVVCLLGGDTQTHSMIEAARHQYLARFGLSFNRAAVIAPHAFGESAHV